MEAPEKVDPSCHIELSTAGLQGIDAERQAISVEFASRDADWHNATTKKLLWKIDLHLLPWVVLMYLTNFLDRKYVSFVLRFKGIQYTNDGCGFSALAQARLGTLEQDLVLKGTQYNTITSILFIVSLSPRCQFGGIDLTN